MATGYNRMMIIRRAKNRALLCSLLTTLCFNPSESKANPEPTLSRPTDSEGDTAQITLHPPNEPAGSELTAQGRDLRGIYVPVGRIGSKKPKQIVHWVRKIDANAVIIDVKDDRGRVTFADDLPYAKGGLHGPFVEKLPKVIETLKKNGIYVIGRLVCFKDNMLPKRRSQAAIIDRRDNTLWKDHTGITWLDPSSPLAHEYIAGIAKEAQELGVDEIQLDYVRFPVEPLTRYAYYPNKVRGMKRYEVIASLLSAVDRAIDIPLSADLFGLTAYNEGDSDGLGQSLEHLAPYLDAISPMLYLANFNEKFWEDPDPDSSYALVHNAIRNIKERLGDGVFVRPLLQGFRYRAKNFGPFFLSNQIDAALAAGSSGYLFWNQSGKYKVLSQIWKNMRSAPAEPDVVDQDEPPQLASKSDPETSPPDPAKLPTEPRSQTGYPVISDPPPRNIRTAPPP